MKKLDIAIIGGGISGLYSAYRLKQRFPDKKIAIFESLPMLGGRIQTGSFHNGLFQPGFGALRIEPDFQTQMHKFVQELKMPTKKIEQGEAGSSSIPNITLLTNAERELINNNPGKDVSDLLLEYALKIILGDQWDLENDHFSDEERDERIKHFKQTAMFNGIPLYQQGAWNVFYNVLSYEAIEFFRDKGPYYNMKSENQNAADWIVLLLNLRLLKQDSYLPSDGMIEMINVMEKKLSQIGVRIYRNHHLSALHQQAQGDIDLTLIVGPKKTELCHIVTKRVILGIPQYPLKQLANYFPKSINILLDSVLPIHILWVAATLKNPPWGKDALPTSGENAPTRAVHLEYKEHEGQSYGMAMLYCDSPWRQFWRYYINDEVLDYNGYQYLPQINESQALKAEIERSLQQMFDMPSKPHVEEYGIRDWGRPPFGAGVHFWKVGAKSNEVIHKLKAFSLLDDKNKNVHICGEAYSEIQGYFEGAIRSANYVVDEIVNTYEEVS